MNAITDAKVREAITEAVEESIRNHENGHHYDAVIVYRSGHVTTTSTERVEGLAHNRADSENVVGSWSWGQYEADEDIPDMERLDAVDALYQQWVEAQ